MLSSCHCFQFNQFCSFKPGRSKWAVFCLAARVHLKLMLIVVVKLMCVCVCAWMQMRSGRINMQLDQKIQALCENNSEKARGNLYWWLTIWRGGTPCVKQRKRGKGVKLQCQSLQAAGRYWKEGEFMPGVWACSAQRASGNADFLLGKSQLLCSGLASCPKTNDLCRDAGGAGKQQAGHGNAHQTLTQKACFGALFILTLLLLLLLFHSVWHRHLQPQAHLTHIKTKSCAEWVQYQQLHWLLCLKTFEFPVTVGAARNFLWLFF